MSSTAEGKGKGHLLVIDDDEQMALSLQHHLRSAYSVCIAASAEAGLELLKSNLIQVVISDQGSPALKSMDFFRRMNDEHPDVVHLILKGHGDIEAASACFSEGSLLRCVTKPWDPNELDRMVREAFELHRLKTDNRRLVRELQEANVALEDRVLQRTNELEQLNEKLLVQIAERERAERSLRDSEQQTRHILDSVQAGIVIVDSQDRLIRYANAAAGKLIGVSCDELPGKVCHSYICPAEEGKCPVLDLGQEINCSERTLLTASGETIPILKSVVPIIVDGRKHLLGNFISLKELKDVERENQRLATQRLHSQKMDALVTLGGGIAHDFNNLLGIIMGHVELALLDVEKDSGVHRNLSVSVKACMQAKALIQKFLALRLKMDQAIECSGSLLKVIREAAELALAGSFVSYEIEAVDDLWSVCFGEEQMKQAFTNILMNAREAAILKAAGEQLEAAGCTVGIRAENVLDSAVRSRLGMVIPVGRYVLISIKDQGLGMHREVLSRIFDPYFSTKSRGVQKGMGLGLTSTYATISGHRGFISAESELGVGTTFHIILPVAEGL